MCDICELFAEQSGRDSTSAAVMKALQWPRFSHHQSVLLMCCWSSLCSRSMVPISSLSLLTIYTHTHAGLSANKMKWPTEVNSPVRHTFFDFAQYHYSNYLSTDMHAHMQAVSAPPSLGSYSKALRSFRLTNVLHVSPVQYCCSGRGWELLVKHVNELIDEQLDVVDPTPSNSWSPVTITCPLLPFCLAWGRSGWIPGHVACIPAYRGAASVW